MTDGELAVREGFETKVMEPARYSLSLFPR
jgi:hypothetical protein